VIGVSTHAIERFRERVPGVPVDTPDEVVERLIVEAAEKAEPWGPNDRHGRHLAIELAGEMFVLGLGPDRRRRGCWVVRTVLTLEQAIVNQQMFGMAS